MVDIQRRSMDAKIAIANKQAERINALFEACKADGREYWEHPKPPLLKSCVEFQTELKHGIEDTRAEDECDSDQLATFPSWGAWTKATDDELERLKTDRW